jgi:ABC-type phosphate transport system permease subunit
MERGILMVAHSLVIGILAYLIMVYLLGQSNMVAEDRSALIGGIALVYMVLYGHGLPTHINSKIYS